MHEHTRTPIGVVHPDDTTGETARGVIKPDGTRLGMRTTVHSQKSGLSQLRDAQCTLRPCANCACGRFVKPGSEKHTILDGYLRNQVHAHLRIWQGLGPESFVYCEDDPKGVGFKWLGYNCPAWRRRQEDLVPDYVPAAVKKVIDTLTAVSDQLRRSGVRGFLAAMRHVLGGGRG
jgi:hypothetical protein